MPDIAATGIKSLPGLGTRRVRLLETELEVRTIRDLLRQYPQKYIDRSRIYHVSEISEGMPFVQLLGQIRSFELQGEGYAMRVVAHFYDGTGFADLVWFRQAKSVPERYEIGRTYLVFGRPTLFKGKPSIAHPEVEDASQAQTGGLGLMPFYATTELMKRSGLNSRFLSGLMASALKVTPEDIVEFLPATVLTFRRLMPLALAYQEIHFPSSQERLLEAQRRFKFEELFLLQLQILRCANDRRLGQSGFPFPRVGGIFREFYDRHLPFDLTEAQKRVLREIRQDLGSGRQMNRLLQGDVGSGKTMVALLTMLLALDNGYQACLMAPTEILAQQHFESLSGYLSAMDVNVRLLTGSVRGHEREEILEGLLRGDVDILIGTHALLEETVRFRSLGLAVIDEQHRFGVAQRARLWTKSGNPPHILVMTATPIPRTLAMTVYGDLDVSVIDELPPGRKPVCTVHRTESHRPALSAFIRDQIRQGRQAYFVYPLIRENEKLDLESLEEGLRNAPEYFPGISIGCVHGKMTPLEKEEQMRLFVSGQNRILFSTTVIEVGVNVPNATVMVVENAERFGLSQLHQLRGRVGRGAGQSYCVLMTSPGISEETRKRMDVMTSTTDGFEIAEADLRMRGPGDLEGTQQSGVAFDLRIANLARDGRILEEARESAREFLDRDPQLLTPEGRLLDWHLGLLRGSAQDWGRIS